MTASALLMAGGQGERMRNSGVLEPKPLVTIHGVPLIALNVRWLLRMPLDELVVAVPAENQEVIDFATNQLASLASSSGVRYRVLKEQSPMGNMGCAATMRDEAEPLVVTFADNVCALDLAELVRHHERANSAMTLAAHEEPLAVPYGQLSLRGGRVVEYREKPRLKILVCSGIAVLSQPAMSLIPTDRPSGMSDLASALIREGKEVAAFQHDAAWVDVNDATALARAEAVVTDHRNLFFDDGDIPGGQR